MSIFKQLSVDEPGINTDKWSTRHPYGCFKDAVSLNIKINENETLYFFHYNSMAFNIKHAWFPFIFNKEIAVEKL